MRYRDINLAEASVENIRVLRQLANAIWSSLPEVPEDTVKDVYLSQLNGFNRIYKAYEGHNKFAKPFQIMETTQLRLVNDESYKDKYYDQNQNIWGYHSSSSDNLLLVWMSNILKQTYAVEASAKSTLVHELRHLFQHALYPKYFNSRQAFTKPYEKQQIEIDAVWSQILGQEIDVEDYRDYPADFVREVMDKLMNTKQLSDSEVQHYSRKTLKYFRQFFDENTEAEWRRIVNMWGKEIKQHSDYSVENFVGDVMQDFTDYIHYKVRDPRIEQQVLDHYRVETRKEYKRLSAEPRQQRKKSALITQLMPTWEKLADRYHEQWFNTDISPSRLAITLVGEMDPEIRKAAGNNPDLYKELSVWILRLTKERIDISRSWRSQPPVTGNKQ